MQNSTIIQRYIHEGKEIAELVSPAYPSCNDCVSLDAGNFVVSERRFDYRGINVSVILTVFKNDLGDKKIAKTFVK